MENTMYKGLAVVVVLVGGGLALFAGTGAYMFFELSLVEEHTLNFAGGLFVSGLTLFVGGGALVSAYKLWTGDIYE